MPEGETVRDDAERLVLPLDKDPESWVRVTVRSVMSGSSEQIKNVLGMALHDIAALAELCAARAAALREARAEIERLREDASTAADAHAYAKQRANKAADVVRRGYGLESTFHSIAAGAYQTGAAAECAKIVAFGEDGFPAKIGTLGINGALALRAFIDAIARGEHKQPAP